ncbi:MAG TPA: hypothetical protein VKI44_07475 [Acetobacteraceae bacterium]|nr:hypothetical protein [Acetobacteraceae bacterium]
MAEGITRRWALQAVAWASTPYLISITARSAFAAPAAAGDYVGVIGGVPGGRIALSTDGQHVLAYVCNGTDTDTANLARWMHGETAGGVFDVGTTGITVIAQLQGDKASGTVILPDGSKHLFLAGSRTYRSADAGLYRAEATFNGVPYVGGWIVNPNRHGAASLQPDVQPVSWSAPLQAGSAATTPGAFEDLELEAEFEAQARTSGAILNQQTGAVLPYAAPNFATMTAEVPGLGTFRLHRCVQTKCT